MSTPPLFGLVLAGGASTRMRRDKAVIDYHGRPQLEAAYELVQSVCTATFVSVRPEQRDEPTRARFPQIIDREPGRGPIAGIAAALSEHAKAAWLVVACDLPFLTRETLDFLLAMRDPSLPATAFRSQHDGLPEPLCAIWEPVTKETVLAAMAAGKDCPRKVLINLPTRLLDLPQARALDNINTPVEHGEALHTINGQTNSHSTSATSAHKSLHIEYYALFREQAGCKHETVETSAATPAALYAELKARHGFALPATQIKVALNDEFASWEKPLANGDRVVFIPPVAGG
jgi:molybdopterin-guanine dinucleotide biosynthesis protein A